MKALAAELNRRLNMLGLPGTLGIGLLLFCGVFFLSTIAPMQGQLGRLHLRSGRLGTAVGGPALAARHLPSAQLAEFYDAFPTGKDIPAALEKIYALAQAQGLQLPKAEYRLIGEADAKLERYQINLPFKASYPQVRRFTAAMLNELQTVSLDELKFERSGSDPNQLEVQIKLTLFVHAASRVGSTLARGQDSK